MINKLTFCSLHVYSWYKYASWGNLKILLWSMGKYKVCKNFLFVESFTYICNLNHTFNN